MRRYQRLMLALVAVLALATLGWAQQQNQNAASNPLIRLLQSKGVITEQEAAQINQLSPAEAEARLAGLLLSKGVISQKEYEETVATHAANNVGTTATPVSATSISGARVVPAVLTGTMTSPATTAQAATAAPKPPEAPKFIAAVAPLRVLPITIPKREGLIPDIKLGNGARLGIYGFLKASAITQSASSGGRTLGANDFPLPMLIGGDTGPNGDPQFFLKARSSRAGANFEWVDVGNKNITLTGKVELDFEGNFTNVNNRNISSLRSSQPGIRLAWVRLDSKLGGTLPWFVQFGQDWTILGSSTLPDYLETTGLGLGMGTFYERAPQFRTGFQFGQGDLKFQPEFAMTLPIFGEPGLDVDQRTRFGGRAGSDSNEPEVQGRLVVQYPLSKAAGVAPAQFIVSGGHAKRTEFTDFASIPTTVIAGLTGCGSSTCSLRSFFPKGISLETDRNVWTAEVQLPTQWVTVVAKYYRGADLRFYFVGQLTDVFADRRGLPAITLPATVMAPTTFTGRALTFLNNGGTAVVAPFQPVRAQGGFLQLGFPLSRLFGATPGGRNEGWSFYLGYGTDDVLNRDAIRANSLLRTDLETASLRYKLNKWVTFAHEVSYIDSRVPSQFTGTANRRFFAGLEAHRAHAIRNEFGTIFSF